MRKFREARVAPTFEIGSEVEVVVAPRGVAPAAVGRRGKVVAVTDRGVELDIGIRVPANCLKAVPAETREPKPRAPRRGSRSSERREAARREEAEDVAEIVQVVRNVLVWPVGARFQRGDRVFFRGSGVGPAIFTVRDAEPVGTTRWPDSILYSLDCTREGQGPTLRESGAVPVGVKATARASQLARVRNPTDKRLVVGRRYVVDYTDWPATMVADTVFGAAGDQCAGRIVVEGNGVTSSGSAGWLRVGDEIALGWDYLIPEPVQVSLSRVGLMTLGLSWPAGPGAFDEDPWER